MPVYEKNALLPLDKRTNKLRGTTSVYRLLTQAALQDTVISHALYRAHPSLPTAISASRSERNSISARLPPCTYRRFSENGT